MHMNKLWAALLTVCFVGAGCAGTARLPAWIGKNWQENEYFYFSGISAPTANPALARQDAFSNALASASEYLGTRVYVQTQSTLSNARQDIELHFSAETEDFLFLYGEVKDFYLAREESSFIGHLLLAFKKSDLDNAQKTAARQKQQAARKRQKNAASGFWKIVPPADWEILAGAVEKKLQNQGFQFRPKGQPLYIRLLHCQCNSLPAYKLQSCVLTVHMQLPAQQYTLQLHGFGKNRAEISRDMLGEWEREVERLMKE